MNMIKTKHGMSSLGGGGALVCTTLKLRDNQQPPTGADYSGQNHEIYFVCCIEVRRSACCSRALRDDQRGVRRPARMPGGCGSIQQNARCHSHRGLHAASQCRPGSKTKSLTASTKNQWLMVAFKNQPLGVRAGADNTGMGTRRATQRIRQVDRLNSAFAVQLPADLPFNGHLAPAAKIDH